MPNKTNGYQRKAQATIGGTGQSAVVVSTAAWGHEGGNEVTVEFAAQTGNNLPLRCRSPARPSGPAGHERHRRPVEHRGAGRGRDRGRLTGPDRPRAPVPDQRRHRRRRGDARPGRADRLPRSEAHGRARGRGPARPVRDPRAAHRQPHGQQARRADPGVRPRPRVGADDDHARDRRAPDRQLPDRPGDPGHPRQRRHLPGAGQQPGRRELLVLQLQQPAPQHDQPLPGRERRSGPPQRVGRRPQPQLPLRVGLRRLRRRVDELHQRHVPGPVRALRARGQERDLAGRALPATSSS